MTTNDMWWKGCVIYQIYTRSFMDSNGDGIGDLVGILEKLEYVANLGVDAIWISPFFKSPMKDFGYDVSDYRQVDPCFGCLSDVDRLIEKAHSFGLKVILDQVLSHTSDKHDWFEQSRQDKTNAKADWYVWADPKADGSAPNNWLSLFGGGAWTWDARRRQYYLHNFLSCQPDLNFHQPEVRKAQLENVKFWLDRGIDGIRLDVVNYFFHNKALIDNEAVDPGSDRTAQSGSYMPHSYQQHQHNISQPDTLVFIEELKALQNDYPGTVSLAEISAGDQTTLLGEYTSGEKRLDMAYTFSLLRSRCTSDYIKQTIKETEDKLKQGWPCWAVSNHDAVRCVTRWGKNTDSIPYAKVVLAFLLCLRGSAVIYQGEELGLKQSAIPFELIQDPLGIPFWPNYAGRDGCRTPMIWDNESHCAGFTRGEPWLPLDNAQLDKAVNKQEEDEASVLRYFRAFIAWRKPMLTLTLGTIDLIESGNDILCWLRTYQEESIFVAFNLSANRLSMPLPFPALVPLECCGFTGYIDAGRIVLEPYQALFAKVIG